MEKILDYNSLNIGIYDPIANTYTGGSAHEGSANVFLGCTMMPNGKVLIVPFNSANIDISTLQ